MSAKYSQFLEVATIRHRSVSYDELTPKPDSKGVIPGKIKINLQQAFELMAPYCGVRIVEQLKAVVPLAAYLMLFQILVLRFPLDRYESMPRINCRCYRTCNFYGRPQHWFNALWDNNWR